MRNRKKILPDRKLLKLKGVSFDQKFFEKKIAVPKKNKKGNIWSHLILRKKPGLELLLYSHCPSRVNHWAKWQRQQGWKAVTEL